MLQRTRIPELMDDPRLDRELHLEALEGLQLLNRLSGSVQILWTELSKLPCTDAAKPIRVLDIATGSGDIVIELAKLSKRLGRHFAFTGTDISPTAVEQAQENAKRADVNAQFMRLDVINGEIPQGFDVVITSLFTHHLDPEQVVSLLKRIRESDAKMILNNDLVRSQLSYSLVWLATRIVTRSPVVHFDGPVSVRASYTPDEMLDMAHEAGLEDSSIKLHPPCRQLLIWRRP